MVGDCGLFIWLKTKYVYRSNKTFKFTLINSIKKIIKGTWWEDVDCTFLA